MIDIYLTEKEDNKLDFEFNDKGDIKTIDSFESSILIALFAHKHKEIVLNNEEGAELYKLDQSKITTNNLNMYRYYANSALEYLSKENIINSKEVAIQYKDGLELSVILNLKENKEIIKYEYKI
jgi:phage gp46-like protein